jgi:hypothetical protein
MCCLFLVHRCRVEHMLRNGCMGVLQSVQVIFLKFINENKNRNNFFTVTKTLLILFLRTHFRIAIPIVCF